MAVKRRKKARTPLRRILRFVAATIAAFMFASLLLVVAMRWLDPPLSAVMLQRQISEGAPQSHEWMPIEEIDRYAALAVVAAEDQRFPEHWGFDLDQVAAAVETRLAGGSLRGASTISQQVARNLFLWQGRSWLRKALEVWFTGLIEVAWPKRRILELYLNFAETGNRLFGFPAASRHYFGRDPGALGQARAALLAAVLPNPIRLRVDRPSSYVLSRRDWIQTQMSNLGGLSYLSPILDQH